MGLLIKSFLRHSNPEIRSAAQNVKKVFKKYEKAIIKENYATKSSLIFSLLEDLGDEGLQEPIAQIPGCAGIIAALDLAQNDFETTRIAYEEEKASDGVQANASELKKEVLDLINDKIVLYLNAMLMLDEATYGDFARTVATIIADNNEAVKKRRKKARKTPASETEE